MPTSITEGLTPEDLNFEMAANMLGVPDLFSIKNFAPSGGHQRPTHGKGGDSRKKRTARQNAKASRRKNRD